MSRHTTVLSSEFWKQRVLQEDRAMLAHVSGCGALDTRTRAPATPILPHIFTGDAGRDSPLLDDLSLSRHSVRPKRFQAACSPHPSSSFSPSPSICSRPSTAGTPPASRHSQRPASQSRPGSAASHSSRTAPSRPLSRPATASSTSSSHMLAFLERSLKEEKERRQSLEEELARLKGTGSPDKSPNNRSLTSSFNK